MENEKPVAVVPEVHPNKIRVGGIEFYELINPITPNQKYINARRYDSMLTFGALKIHGTITFVDNDDNPFCSRKYKSKNHRNIIIADTIRRYGLQEPYIMIMTPILEPFKETANEN